MRRLLFWAVVVAAVWFVVSHVADLSAVVSAIASASAAWLLAAALLQVTYYIAYSAAYRRAFAVVGMRRPLRQLVAAVLGALFVNVVTPTAGTAGPALIIDDAVQHGGNGPLAAAATLLAQACVFLGNAVLIAPGMVVLAEAGRMGWVETLAAIVLAGIVLAHLAVLAMAIKRPQALLHVLLGLQDAAERMSAALKHEVRIADDWAERSTRDLQAGAELVARDPRGALSTLACAVIGYAFDLASLYAIAMAFGLRLGAPEILAAYAVGKLLWIVSPIPQGIGIVEGAMTFVLTSFGESPGLAGVVALTFRGLSFWLPFLLGMLLLRSTGSFSARRTPTQSSVPSE